MHRRGNCHRHIWLLSGTGEGPPFAKALIEHGWKVTVSVVSYQASLSYKDLPLESLNVGAIEGVDGIINFLLKSEKKHQGFRWVIDMTHPFAVLISNYLKGACNQYDQPLIRFERPFQDCSDATVIKSLRDFTSIDLRSHRILIALGSRCLSEAVAVTQESGADVFARVLPTPMSLRNALACHLPQDNLALLRPSEGKYFGDFELALCRKWAITGIVCRQSGGKMEKLWRQISIRNKLKLWIMSRPNYPKEVEIIHNTQDILDRIDTKHF